MPLAATPSLNTDHIVASGQDAELDGLRDPPLETSVDIFLPVVLVKVGLILIEQERIDAAIQVRILPDCLVRSAEGFGVECLPERPWGYVSPL